MKKILLVPMALLAAVSCSKSRISVEQKDDPVPIALGMERTLEFTKAPLDGKNAFDAQVIGITTAFSSFTDDATHLYSDHNENAFDKSVTFTDGIGRISEPIVYYPKDYLQNVYFKGFVPSDAGSTDVTRTDTEVVFQKIEGKTDIMVTDQVSGNRQSAKALDLTFSHLLSQVIFKVRAENLAAVKSWGKITGIKILHQHHSYSLDLKTDQLSPLSPFSAEDPKNYSDFVAYHDPVGQELQIGSSSALLYQGANVTDNNGILMVAPTSEAWEIEVTSTNEPEGQRFRLDPSVNEAFRLEAGKANEITLNFKTHIVSMSSQVTEWVAGNKTMVNLN